MATVEGAAKGDTIGQVIEVKPFRQYGSKRALDLVAASVGLAVAALPAAVLSLLIRLSSPGPVFFKQVRVGNRVIVQRKDKLAFRDTDSRVCPPGKSKICTVLNQDNRWISLLDKGRTIVRRTVINHNNFKIRVCLGNQ